MKLLNKITFVTLITGMLLSPVLVFAHGKGGHLHQRFERQQQRIENGMESGVLTRREAKKLRREQRKIRKMAREFHEDGVLTKRERRKIRKKLNRASDRIWEFKHNERSRHENYNHRNFYHDHWSGNHEKSWKSRSWSHSDSDRSGYKSFRY